MKRVLIIAAAMLLVTASLFASEGRIGVSLAPEWMWYTNAEDSGKMDFALMAEGANYFGKKGGGFGIEYGLGVKFPVSTWVAGSDPIDVEDGKSSFLFKAGVGYKHAFSDVFGISAGLGVRGDISSTSEGGSWGGISVSGRGTTFVMDIYGSVSADLTLMDFLGIRIGAMAGGPVLGKLRTTVQGGIGDFGGSHSETTDLGIEGFWLAPFVGVSYVY